MPVGGWSGVGGWDDFDRSVFKDADDRRCSNPELGAANRAHNCSERLTYRWVRAEWIKRQDQVDG